jgi:hypothetical protein
MKPGQDARSSFILRHSTFSYWGRSMERRASFFSPRALAMLATLLVPTMFAAGCANWIAGAMWLVKGTNRTAECNALKGQRVVVVCRPPVEMEFSDGAVGARELGVAVGELLDSNVRKIDIVDHREVEEWTDEHTWQEYTEVGEALDAEMLVGIDLTKFNIYAGQTLYQGTAEISLTVYDMKEDGKVVYERMLQVKYPPQAPMARESKSPAAFRREFTAVVARQIGKLFYDYDSFEDYAIDAKVL